MEPVKQAPLVFTAGNRAVELENCYHGRSAFLICGGPSFAKLDPAPLRRPGVVTMAVNNSVKSFRPRLWTCVDNPDHFLRSIWLDPDIIKFAPIKQVNARVFDSDRWEYMRLRISQCPATFFYHRNAEFNAGRFLTEPTINWGNDEKNGGGRSVMLVAIRLLYYLGIRRIFLLGCDFKMEGGYTYHFDQARAPGSVNGNNGTYRLLNERFRQLRPVFEAAGLRVFNCNPDSGLDAFEKIPFERALEMAGEEWSGINIAAERTAGLYDQAKPMPPTTPPPRNRFWRPAPAIPALAHFVWLGSPLPKLAAEFIERFKAIHPAWQVKVWTALPPDMPADLRRLAENAPQFHQQADLVRLWALSAEGGVSLDADFYVTRSLEELRHYDHFVVQGPGSKVSTGMMGFAKGAPELPPLLDMARQAGKAPNPPRAAFGTNLLTEFNKKTPGRLNVLPEHYAYIIRTQGTALDYIQRTPPQRADKLKDLMGRMTDDVHPFAVHLWGFPSAAPAPQPVRATPAKPAPPKPAPAASAAPRIPTQPPPGVLVKKTRKIVLQAPAFIGDQVLFTGVVRQLKQAAPDWLLDVQTSHPDLWLHNPHLTRLDRTAKDVTILTNHFCPSFRQSNNKPMHALELYCRRVGEALGIQIPVREFRGDIHLSEAEAAGPPPCPELAGARYWVIVAGCKKGVPIKGWGTANYQAVVDIFRGRLLFAQTGSRSDAHPPLRNAVHLVGKSSVRELVRLIYHAEGVLCPITSAMHLAAAVPMKPGQRKLRPCVVIAGGREPVHHIAYPGHRVLHTIGALPCCATGGCGQSRFKSETDKNGCAFPVPQPGGLPVPKCMAMVPVQEVVQAVEQYYRGGVLGLPPSIGRVRTLLRRLPDTPLRGAEIGVFYGKMSAQLLAGHRALHLVMVDRWATPSADTPCAKVDANFYGRPQARFDAEYARAMNATDFARDRRTVLRVDSAEAAKQVPDGSLDFVFIDGDHSYEGCAADIAAWLPKVKPGAWLCGHDYHRPGFPLEGVKKAVDEFAAGKGMRVETDADNTWFIRV